MASIKLVTAEDIRRLRKMLRLTQRELAKKAGVSQSLVARIENKSIDPRLSTVKKIVDVLTENKERKTVADLMHSPVITVDAREPVRMAVDLMDRYKISQIPVLREGKVIGSIQEATIVERIIKRANPEKVFSSPVYSVMEKRFATVTPTTLVSDVVYLLSQGETAVLVIDSGKLVGIVTKIDVISSVISLRKDLEV